MKSKVVIYSVYSFIKLFLVEDRYCYNYVPEEINKLIIKLSVFYTFVMYIVVFSPYLPRAR